MNYKQAIIIRKDLKMSIGKTATQSAHASVEAVLKSDKKIVEKWRSEGMKKIVLKVSSIKELLELKKLAHKYGLTSALITDSGLTFFKGPTITCLGIGPDLEEKIDKITSKLKML